MNADQICNITKPDPNKMIIMAGSDIINNMRSSRGLNVTLEFKAIEKYLSIKITTV